MALVAIILGSISLVVIVGVCVYWNCTKSVTRKVKPFEKFEEKDIGFEMDGDEGKLDFSDSEKRNFNLGEIKELDETMGEL